MIIMYGIPNCDTVKKARKWLDANDIDFQFHNCKKDGIEPEQLADWVDQLGWEILLNKRGTTWRKLPDEQKIDIDHLKAITLMATHTSMIKRPVLISGDHIEVGFSESRYQALFN